jgi:hypothetical protein
MDKMLRRNLVLAILSMGCILTGEVQAATLEVAPSGYPYTSIQAAINAAVDGDTVLVHDGTYVENINFLGKAITVKSVNGAASTINGNGSSSLVTFNHGEGSGSVLDGFTMTNCIVGGNTASTGGGIYCYSASSPTIINSTISGNTANTGAGIYCDSTSSSSVKNTILWGDVPNEIYLAGSSITIIYSDVDQDGYAGSSGNIRQDPLFFDSANGDFSLQSASPCIDAGTSDGSPATDMKDSPRSDTPQIPNTGGGTYAYYDMGALEYVPLPDLTGQ